LKIDHPSSNSGSTRNVKCRINTVVWDGKDDNGRAMPSRVYIYKLSSGNENETGRMVINK